MERRTKIVATLGPASDDPERIRELIRAGVDFVRLNLSHGTVDEHLERMRRVRRAADDVGRYVGVLADLPGPEIRLRPGDGPSAEGTITVPYETLLDDLQPGSRVQLGDGAISLDVTSVDERVVTARIETGGMVRGRPGVHIPSERLRLRTPTSRDLELADEMSRAGADLLAVSFVRRPEDIETVRDHIGGRTRLVSKIETSAAIACLADIVGASDAVMVARGDLGIDCPIEDVPHLQKYIVRHCVEMGKPVITATQMLESMISAPSPTRAEVSDIANSVFDGTDAVMLSGETAIGDYPVEVVRTMSSVAHRAETEAEYGQWARRMGRLHSDHAWFESQNTERVTAAITHAASRAETDLHVDAILCCTRSGLTARAMARFRPETKLYGLSPDPVTLRTMALIWGVEPLEVDAFGSSEAMVHMAVGAAKAHGKVVAGDLVLVLAGIPDMGEPVERGVWGTDLLRIVAVD
jgi:pyruvate kinase